MPTRHYFAPTSAFQRRLLRVNVTFNVGFLAVAGRGLAYLLDDIEYCICLFLLLVW